MIPPTEDLITAIPTEYRGIQLRSRMEAQCALLFDRLGWAWKYEPKSFMLANGVSYMPDFYIPEIETVIECRGYDSDKGRSQIECFSKEFEQHGFRQYAVIGPVGVATLFNSAYGYHQSCDAYLCYCRQCSSFRFIDVDRCVTCRQDAHHSHAMQISASKGKISFWEQSSDRWDLRFFDPALHISLELYERLCVVLRAADRKDLLIDLGYMPNTDGTPIKLSQRLADESTWNEVRKIAAILFPELLSREDLIACHATHS